jgi:hypothetical protein
MRKDAQAAQHRGRSHRAVGTEVEIDALVIVTDTLAVATDPSTESGDLLTL